MPDVRVMHQELLGGAVLWVLAGRAGGGSTLHADLWLPQLHPRIIFPRYVLMVPVKRALHSHINSWVRKPHLNTGQPRDLVAMSSSAVSTQLEAETASPWLAHSSVFAEAEDKWTERALPWQQAVTVSLGADGEVVLRHASGFRKV